MLRRLARWALRYGPVVHLDGDDGLFIDLSGTQHVHASEWDVAWRISQGLARAGFTARVAVADTPGAAWAVAHYGAMPCEVVGRSATRAALEGLPLEALRLEARVIERLWPMGVRTCGQLLALPRGGRQGVASRFGMEVIRRIDQALGLVDEPLSAVRPAAAVGVVRKFESPTPQQEAIVRCTGELLEELMGVLDASRGVCEVRLVLERASVAARLRREVIDVRLSRASRSIKHVWNLLRLRLERIDMAMGGAGVEVMRLTARRTGRIVEQQREMTSTLQDDAAILQTPMRIMQRAEMLDTLAARLSTKDRAAVVLRAAAGASHLPERAWRLVQVDGREDGAERRGDAATEGRRAVRARPRGGAMAQAGDEVMARVPPRPTELLATPEAAEVMRVSPDGAVLAVTWRGERAEVAWSRGPERIGDQWWLTGPSVRRATRDYMMLGLRDGRVLWICRAEAMRADGSGMRAGWFVHGQWV
jgi:protein ImuB